MTARPETEKHASRRRLVLATSVVFLTVCSGSHLAAQYPTGPQLTKDGTAIALEDYASLPISSVTTSTYPPSINYASQLGRANFLRSEPTGAPHSVFRFFVIDSNRSLYILDRAARTVAPYLNFEEIFPKFDNYPGLSGGLVAVQFAPDYTTSGKLYTVHVEDPAKSGSDVPVNTTTPGLNVSGYTTTTSVSPPAGTVVRQAVIVEWVDTNIANATFQGTARELLRIGFAANYHPVGDLIFNPLAQPGTSDYGNLYVAVGDGFAGETSGSTHTIPQRLDALQGKILRITPDITLRPGDQLSSNGRYRIPTTGVDRNPFWQVVLTNLKKEIYAYGFRNPHRLSWDSISNQLIVNDIGLNSWEEVNLVVKGGNYGYAEREGSEQLFIGGTNHQKVASQISPIPAFPSPDTLTVAGLPSPVTPLYPAMAYSHKEGDAMSSGFVYRGALIPDLYGMYVFGDITTGRIFYSSLASMTTATRTSPAPIYEVQVVYSSPYDSLGPRNRRVYDIIADAYKARGGDSNPSSEQGVLPQRETTVGGFSSLGVFTPGTFDIEGVQYGGGRSDIRIAEGGDNEIYVLSKADGFIRMAMPVSPVGPAIVGQPQNVTITAGENATFGVVATGTAPLGYQWRKGGNPIGGATAATLVLTNAQPAASGSYDVVITNGSGKAISSSAMLVVNQPPFANGQSVNGTEDTPLGITVSAGDPEGQPITYTVVNAPTNGTLTGSLPSVTYQPGANFNGGDSFTYRVSDGSLSSPIATVTIAVAAVNDPPAAISDFYSVNKGASLTVNLPGVLENDSDVDSASITAQLLLPPTNGAATLNANGSFTYTPTAAFEGFDWFAYHARDGSATSVPVATIIWVLPPPLVLIGGFVGGTEGFVYVDDPFRGTNQPSYASGSSVATGAYNGSGFRISLGGVNNNTISNMSGGWRRSFSLSAPTQLALQFRYRLDQGPDYEASDVSQVLASLDGVLVGGGVNGYITQVAGNGNGGASIDTGWQVATIGLGVVPAGTHTVTIGGYNNQKNSQTEETTIWIDEVVVVSY